MPDVYCLGELIVDWLSLEPGVELEQAASFTKAAGGAPANVAVGLARQGIAAGFIGRVGGDRFGAWLKQLLADESIDVSMTHIDPNATTRMAYVTTTQTGDRKLAEFSQFACADGRLSSDDIHSAQLGEARILHFGSITLIGEPSASATLEAARSARERGLLVSYDPNVRLALWPSAKACKQAITDTLSLAHVVKISIEELKFLTGSSDPSAAVGLLEKHNIALLVVTMDRHGCHCFCATWDIAVGGHAVVAVDSTGAGDAFVACLLAGLLPHLRPGADVSQCLAAISQPEMQVILKRANAVGALACTKAGAIPSLPDNQQIEAFLTQTN